MLLAKFPSLDHQISPQSASELMSPSIPLLYKVVKGQEPHTGKNRNHRWLWESWIHLHQSGTSSVEQVTILDSP